MFKIVTPPLFLIIIFESKNYKSLIKNYNQYKSLRKIQFFLCIVNLSNLWVFNIKNYFLLRQK